MNTASISPFVVETAGLTKRFGERTVVREVDLRVPRGAAFGYLGPNGASKCCERLRYDPEQRNPTHTRVRARRPRLIAGRSRFWRAAGDAPCQPRSRAVAPSEGEVGRGG